MTTTEAAIQSKSSAASRVSTTLTESAVAAVVGRCATFVIVILWPFPVEVTVMGTPIAAAVESTKVIVISVPPA